MLVNEYVQRKKRKKPLLNAVGSWSIICLLGRDGIDWGGARRGGSLAGSIAARNLSKSGYKE